MKGTPSECFIAHDCGSIIFVNDPTDRDPSGWTKAFGDSAWFGESLPDSFPTTRRYVFAWQPQNVQTSPVDVVQNAAQCLLVQWARLDTDISRNPSDWSIIGIRERRHSVHRPVLFVCKSLGGLVVQKVRSGRNVKVILTLYRLYYYLSQKVEILHLRGGHLERYDMHVQYNSLCAN